MDVLPSGPVKDSDEGNEMGDARTQSRDRAGVRLKGRLESPDRS